MSMESNGEEYTKLMDKIEDIDKEVDRIQLVDTFCSTIAKLELLLFI